MKSMTGFFRGLTGFIGGCIATPFLSIAALYLIVRGGYKHLRKKGSSILASALKSGITGLFLLPFSIISLPFFSAYQCGRYGFTKAFRSLESISRAPQIDFQKVIDAESSVNILANLHEEMVRSFSKIIPFYNELNTLQPHETTRRRELQSELRKLFNEGCDKLELASSALDDLLDMVEGSNQPLSFAEYLREYGVSLDRERYEIDKKIRIGFYNDKIKSMIQNAPLVTEDKGNAYLDLSAMQKDQLGKSILDESKIEAPPHLKAYREAVCPISLSNMAEIKDPVIVESKNENHSLVFSKALLLEWIDSCTDRGVLAEHPVTKEPLSTKSFFTGFSKKVIDITMKAYESIRHIFSSCEPSSCSSLKDRPVPSSSYLGVAGYFAVHQTRESPAPAPLERPQASLLL